MQITAPFELILFGGLGDLSLRKLIPALYMVHWDGRLPEGKIIVLTRRSMEHDEFLSMIEKDLQKHVQKLHLEADVVNRFLNQLVCHTLDASDPSAYSSLSTVLAHEDINRTYYLATGSELYSPICQGLSEAGLIGDNSKVVLEKPIGHDYESAKTINLAVAEYFQEKQIYRIDHYLGKETVQNLMVLRFANSLF